MRAYTRMYWEKEVPVLRSSGLHDGMSIVELGSGPGVVTDLLLNLLPASTVTSVELREDEVQRARVYLKGQGHDRFRLVQADILHTGLPAGAFDFAYGRLVFRYLSDPLGAMKEARRILKPGGRLVISDVDHDLWGIFDPPLPELRPALEAYGRMLAGRGGDAHIGRRLVGLLEAAGFAGTRMRATAATSDDLPEGLIMDTFLAPLGFGRLQRMVDRGLLSREELAQARQAWKHFLASPSPFALKVMLTACGKKPSAPNQPGSSR